MQDLDPPLGDLCTNADSMLLLARVELCPRSLVVTTNSTRRADETCELLTSRLGDLVEHVDRDERDPWDFEDDEEDRDAEKPALAPEEEATLIRSFKEQHYATWPDIPLPALEGLTPREAARDEHAESYRKLDVVLREIERGESMLPFEQRYDVGDLRRELGLQ